MRKLDKQLLVQVIREEWNRKKDSFLNENSNFATASASTEKVVPKKNTDHGDKEKKEKGVKLSTKDSKLDLISPDLVVTDPEGKEFTVDDVGSNSLTLKSFETDDEGNPIVKNVTIPQPEIPKYKVK